MCTITPDILEALREAEKIMNNTPVPTDSRIIYPDPEDLREYFQKEDT